MQADVAGGLELWSVESLVDLVPGSSRKLWLVSWIPNLKRSGALRKVGRKWIGRRSVIERELLSGPTTQKG